MEQEMSEPDLRAKAPARPMTLELATRIAGIASGQARGQGFSVSVAIVDDAGHLVFFSRGDQCGHITFETARGKAVLAAGFRLPASRLRGADMDRAVFWASVTDKLGMVVADGGYPLTANGVTIGAIGCGGGHGDQDERCARMAAEAVNT